MKKEIKKKVRDPIYGYIEIPKELEYFVDHKLVQRLRWINQLPLEQLVYPSAQHSRFEHSLGVMHLAMFAYRSLLDNSKSELKKILEKESKFFKKFNKNDEEQLKLAAGLSGLVHDIGHAPFSHTFEDLSNFDIYDYDHEKVGYKLFERVIGSKNDIFIQITKEVLNKDLEFEDLDPASQLIRQLIDNDFDVDKGDYLLRDAYHCGVSYENYDFQHLWSNIVLVDKINNENNETRKIIGVSEKAALEVWTLRIARFKMHAYVYKHKTRNITDALLLEILNQAAIEDKNSIDQRFKFLKNEACIPNDDNLQEFFSWNDQAFISFLSTITTNVKSKIDEFIERNLQKHSLSIELTGFMIFDQSEKRIENRNRKKLQKNVIQSLTKSIQKIKDDFENINIRFNFIINRYVKSPVFEKAVQENIIVSKKIVPYKNEVEFIKLSEYLEIRNETSQTQNPVIEIFMNNNDITTQVDKIKVKIDELVERERDLSNKKLNEMLLESI